jgi:arylsulfatase A-like enzyme
MLRRLWKTARLAVILPALIATLCGSSALQGQAAGPVKRPNLIVILADDLGFGDTSSYGATDLATPHIDMLVARGMRFDHFYANCPVCSPTRAALLSGCYADRVGVPGVIRTHDDNNWGYLDPATVLLPRLLQQQGYRTALVGKWHLGLEEPNRPNERGFELFHGFLGDMMDDYYDHRRHGINYMRLDKNIINPQGHATDLFSDWACEFLETDHSGRPFFLYLAYNAPHSPIQPPEEWLRKVHRREQGISSKRAKLVALIEHMDDGIGRVLQTLMQRGLDENTLIVFTSDNGGSLRHGARNGPLRDGKGSMYEGGLRVPAAVAWPGKIQPATRTPFQAMTMDILPTLLEAAGVACPHEIDGKSFLPTLLGREQPPLRNDWFFRRREGGSGYGGKTIEAVRRGEWKLLQNSPFAPMELYHLHSDPLEQENRIELDREVFKELSAALRKEIQRYGRVAWQRPTP